MWDQGIVRLRWVHHNFVSFDANCEFPLIQIIPKPKQARELYSDDSMPEVTDDSSSGLLPAFYLPTNGGAGAAHFPENWHILKHMTDDASLWCPICFIFPT